MYEISMYTVHVPICGVFVYEQNRKEKTQDHVTPAVNKVLGVF